MSDRLCIHSNYTIQVVVSARDLMACCTACGNGCFGGTPLDGWTYWITTGLVTGGEYNTTEVSLVEFYVFLFIIIILYFFRVARIIHYRDANIMDLVVTNQNVGVILQLPNVSTLAMLTLLLVFQVH